MKSIQIASRLAWAFVCLGLDQLQQRVSKLFRSKA